MGFQTKLNGDLPQAVAGDFASTNPYHTLLSGEGSFKAGESGVTVGTFAWVDESNGTVQNVAIASARFGFVGRMNIGVATEYLGESSMKINKGLGITLYDGGDFWVTFKDGAVIGEAVYALKADGTVVSSASAVSGAINTGFIVQSNADAGGVAKISKF